VQVVGSRLKSAVKVGNTTTNAAVPVPVPSPYVYDREWLIKKEAIYSSPLRENIQQLHGKSASQRMGIVAQPQGLGVGRIGREKAKRDRGIAQDMYRATRF
jgi:hypothetical protein